MTRSFILSFAPRRRPRLLWLQHEPRRSARTASDAGVTPVGDSGPTVTADAATTSPPTPWRHCGADGMSPDALPRDGARRRQRPARLLLELAGIRSAYSPPGSRHGLRPRLGHRPARPIPSGVGAEVDFGFRCAASGEYAVHPGGYDAHVAQRACRGLVRPRRDRSVRGRLEHRDDGRLASVAGTSSASRSAPRSSSSFARKSISDRAHPDLLGWALSFSLSSAMGLTKALFYRK
jgi:hypothetical protein